MVDKKAVIATLLIAFSTTYLTAQTKNLDLADLHGNWHLRTMDGKDVRQARAILDFDAKNKRLNGFDGCSPMSSELKSNNKIIQSKRFSSSKMGCRESIHSYVRTRLHKIVKEGFTVTKTTKDGIDGILIKGAKHELFFKWMSS